MALHIQKLYWRYRSLFSGVCSVHHEKKEIEKCLHFFFIMAIYIPRADGKFLYPIVGCLKHYVNVDTFNKHAIRDHSGSANVVV